MLRLRPEPGRRRSAEVLAPAPASLPIDMRSEQAEELTGEKLAAMRRRRAAIRLGGESMLDVIATAEFLRAWPPEATGDDDLARVRTTLENGMFVTYARPFTSSGLQMLNPAGGLSPELRDLHDEILELPNSVYAHTDATPRGPRRRPPS